MSVVRIGHDAEPNDIKGGKYRYLVSIRKSGLPTNLGLSDEGP